MSTSFPSPRSDGERVRVARCQVDIDITGGPCVRISFLVCECSRFEMDFAIEEDRWNCQQNLDLT